MYVAVISIFPDMFRPFASQGVVSRAISNGAARLDVLNPRDFTDDKHATVDDRPYGGGPGMVMMAGPLARAVSAARDAAAGADPHGQTTTLLMSPQGRRFDHAMARDLAGRDGLILVTGRYEGVDERFVEREVDLEVSIGDYVLTGGELAALVVLDAVLRLLPGTLGNPESVVEESFAADLLDCPHYTRPAQFEGRGVPEVLLSGDHAAVDRWRRKQALSRTFVRRPDMLARRNLGVEERELLTEFMAEGALRPWPINEE
ncbi:MAG: tRNA (guanosine(37)-N1)-methyltransferase TrmD [Gammaproteobacteria bacterium]|nr:tRNA (guanosine(37)-N1)-methyltransferase TrmD [Gammaproteobacteria bacterium]